ncbi:hypothetical protein [Aurantivibrio plasticivorans]
MPTDEKKYRPRQFPAFCFYLVQKGFNRTNKDDLLVFYLSPKSAKRGCVKIWCSGDFAKTINLASKMWQDKYFRFDHGALLLVCSAYLGELERKAIVNQ